MSETIISPDEVFVDNGEGKRHIRIGQSVTFLDSTATRVIADPTVIPDTDPDQKAKKKTKNTERKAGFDDYKDGKWSVGLTDQQGNLYRLNPGAKVGGYVTEIDGQIFHNFTELVDPIKGTPLNDDLGLTRLYGDYGDVVYTGQNHGCATNYDEKAILKADFPDPQTGLPYDYYGTITVVETAEALDQIESTSKDVVAFKDYDNLRLIEYIDQSMWEQDFRHNYITIGGTITSASGGGTGIVTLEGGGAHNGTYQNTGTYITTGKLNIDSSSGEIWVRTTKAAAYIFKQNLNSNPGFGDITSTDTTNKVYFTSEEDWVSGGSGHQGGDDVMAGAGGNPANDDTTLLVNTQNNGNFLVENFECWYCFNPIYNSAAAGESGVFEITDALFDQCSGGAAVRNNSPNTSKLERVKFTSNCSALTSWIDCGGHDGTLNVIDSQISVNMAGNHVVRLQQGIINFTRCLLDGTLTTGNMMYFNTSATDTGSSTCNNCVFDGTNISGAGKFVNINAAAGETANFTVYNCQFTNNDESGAIGVFDDESGGTVNVTMDYNNWYNNDTDVTAVSKGANATAVAPEYTTIAPGAIISSNMDDGWCARSQKNGSDTFDNLSIDEGIYTGSGFQYAGSDKVGIGLLYKVSAFGTLSSKTYGYMI